MTVFPFSISATLQLNEHQLIKKKHSNPLYAEGGHHLHQGHVLNNQEQTHMPVPSTICLFVLLKSPACSGRVFCELLTGSRSEWKQWHSQRLVVPSLHI